MVEAYSPTYGVREMERVIATKGSLLILSAIWQR